jgi:putative flippase GtrA
MRFGQHVGGSVGQPSMEFVRYFSASLIALVLDVAVLQFSARVLHYLVAASLGFVVGAIASYVLATRWVFRRRRLSGQASVEFSAYVSIGLVGLAINDLVIFLAVDQWGLSLIGGKLIAAGITFFFNYAIRKLALF